MENNITKLWNKNFIKYVIAYELTKIGVSLLRFAIPIHILIATGDPTLVGTVFTLVWLPFVLFTPPGGLLADRFNKRRIIILCNFLTAVAIIIYVILTGDDYSHVIPIAMLVLATGLESLQTSSSEAAIFYIVPEDKYLEANSIASALMMGSGILAPIVAGFLLRNFDLNFILYTSMASFLAGTLVYSFLKIPFEKKEVTRGFFKSVTVDLGSSFKYIWGQKVLKRATIGLFFYAVAQFPILALVPSVLINNVLEMSGTSIGWAQGLIQGGGALGLVIIVMFGSKLNINITKLSHLLVISSIIQLLTVAAFIMISDGSLAFATIIIGLLLANTALFVFSAIYFTYVGENTPEEMIGKIMSFAMTIMFLGGAVSQFVTGRLFNLFSDDLSIVALIIPIIILVASFTTRIKIEK